MSSEANQIALPAAGLTYVLGSRILHLPSAVSAWLQRAVDGKTPVTRNSYHRARESIDAHLTIVFAAIVISHCSETQTVWSIKTFVRTAWRYRTIVIAVGDQKLAAADPIPDGLAAVPAEIRSTGAHSMARCRSCE